MGMMELSGVGREQPALLMEEAELQSGSSREGLVL